MKMTKIFTLSFALALAGCSLITSEQVPCPQTAIVAEFSKSLSFHKGTPIRTEMDSLFPHCTRDGHQTHIDLRLRTTSFRPLSKFHHPLTMKISYFVALIDTDGKVLSRSNHDLEVAFSEKQTTKVTFVQIKESIPSNKRASLYVGFNLDENQLELLRKERSKNVENTKSVMSSTAEIK